MFPIPMNDIVSNLMALQMSGGSPELPQAVQIAAGENSVVGGSGTYILTEYYSGKPPCKTKLDVNYFGTANEQLSTIYFLDSEGNTEHTVSFSNFYIG